MSDVNTNARVPETLIEEAARIGRVRDAQIARAEYEIQQAERIAALEAEVERLRGALESVREYARTDIELETEGVMTTSIMAITRASLEPAP